MNFKITYGGGISNLTKSTQPNLSTIHTSTNKLQLQNTPQSLTVATVAPVPTSTTDQTQSSIGIAMLRAPEQFLGTANQNEVAFDVQACIEGMNLCTHYQQIRVRRAPVILIHGLWGDANSFIDNTLNNDMTRRIGNSHFVVRPFVYDGGQGPTRIMTTDARGLHDLITQTCSTLSRNSHNGTNLNIGFSCTRADVVAHSMGGLMVRKYIFDNKFYKTNLNFFNGSIRRVITLGTPHKGSELANLLRWETGTPTEQEANRQTVSLCLTHDNNVEQSQKVIQERLGDLRDAIEDMNSGTVNMPTNGGAIADLRVGSALLNQLNKASKPDDLPVRQIFGNIGQLFLNSFDDLDGIDGNGRNIVGCTPQEVYGNQNTDGVVSVSSASAWLLTTAEQFANVMHTGVRATREGDTQTLTDNELVINRVIELLNSAQF
jgi:triacylglycerol esterase/lipase EstA (alpha/beta hydrolase family)